MMFGQSGQTSTKSVCSYYQRGNCKFGNKCFNLHPGSAGSAANNVFAGGSSSQKFTTFGNNGSNIQDKQFLEFVKQVGSEMTMWEKTGLWQLSCLSPLKEHPILSGFIDTSPEELRVEAYEALKSNSSAAYQENVNQKLEYHIQLRQALKNQVPEAIDVLKDVYYKTASANSNSQSGTSLFGKASGTFGGNSSAPNSSLFGGSVTNSNQAPSVFGGTANPSSSSMFGAKLQNSAFGGTPVFGSSTSKIFGGGNSFKSTFGGQSSSNNLFGGLASANETNQSVFGASQSQGNIFGGSSQQQTGSSSSVFGNASISQAQGPSNIFGSGTVNNVQNPGSSGLFGNGTVSTVQSQSSSSLFGNGNTNSLQNQTSTNIFGNGTGSVTTQPIFGGNNRQQLFGGSGTSQTTVGSNSVFGNSNLFTQTQPQPSNVFGGAIQQDSTAPPPFGASSQSPGSNQSNVFGGGSTTVAATHNAGFFNSGSQNQMMNPSNEGIFGNNLIGTANPFGKTEVQAQNDAPANIFGSVGTANQHDLPTTGQQNQSSWFSNTQMAPFGAPNNAEKANTSVGFGQSNQQTTLTNQQFPNSDKPFNDSNSNINNSCASAYSNVGSPSIGQIYTPMHLLSLDDRAEFERDVFLRIPLIPPPKELCA